MRKRILEILAKDSRIAADDIAVMLGLETEAVQREIAAMEAERVILDYGALINWEKAGEDLVSALIDVKVIPQRDEGFDQVAEMVFRFPEVRSVSLMSGGYDLSVLIEGKTLKEVALFVAEKLATLEHVQGTMTHFVLKKYKQNGIIFESGEKDRRQAVSA